MDISLWLLFVFMATLNIISPGQAILLAISNSVLYGIRSSIISSFGNMVGLLCLSGVVIFGLSSILKTYPILFTLLKLIGVGYLIYVGILKIISKENIFNGNIIDKKKKLLNYHFFYKGFLLAVTNPKPLLFFAAIYPPFINQNLPLVPQFSILTATFMIISFFSLIVYSSIGLLAKSWLSHSNRVMWFNRLSGIAFILLGLSMLMIEM